jgi:hypothetical protein
VEVVLDLVLLTKARRGLGRLGPEVGDGIVAAQFERGEVIDLEGTARLWVKPYSVNASRRTSDETLRRSFVERWHTTSMSVVATAPGGHAGSGSGPRTAQAHSFVRGGGE